MLCLKISVLKAKYVSDSGEKLDVSENKILDIMQNVKGNMVYLSLIDSIVT
jgi:hypothetical protein